MPRERESITHKFSIAGHEGYITAGKYEDGSVGEIFLTDIGKEGSTLRGMMNAFATAISIGLQYGVPLETFVKKFSYMRFDPEGITGNPEIPFAKSMPDYIMRWLGSRFIDDLDELEDLGILTPEVRARKEAQQALFADERPRERPGNGGQRARRQRFRGAARRPRPQPAAAALTDTPPVVPARMAGARPRPRLRAVRRDDAAHRLLLHVLELRQQHRLRLSCRASSDCYVAIKPCRAGASTPRAPQLRRATSSARVTSYRRPSASTLRSYWKRSAPPPRRGERRARSARSSCEARRSTSCACDAWSALVLIDLVTLNPPIPRSCQL